MSMEIGYVSASLSQGTRESSNFLLEAQETSKCCSNLPLKYILTHKYFFLISCGKVELLKNITRFDIGLNRSFRQ